MSAEGKNRDPREAALAAQRPTHPDFWRLSEVVRAHDDRANVAGLAAVVADLADLDSVSYMADQRVMRVEELVLRSKLGPRERTVLEGLFMDAFYLGVGFQRAGGHQEEE